MRRALHPWRQPSRTRVPLAPSTVPVLLVQKIFTWGSLELPAASLSFKNIYLIKLFHATCQVSMNVL